MDCPVMTLDQTVIGFAEHPTNGLYGWSEACSEKPEKQVATVKYMAFKNVANVAAAAKLIWTRAEEEKEGEITQTSHNPVSGSNAINTSISGTVTTLVIPINKYKVRWVDSDGLAKHPLRIFINDLAKELQETTNATAGEDRNAYWQYKRPEGVSVITSMNYLGQMHLELKSKHGIEIGDRERVDREYNALRLTRAQQDTVKAHYDLNGIPEVQKFHAAVRRSLTTSGATGVFATPPQPDGAESTPSPVDKIDGDGDVIMTPAQMAAFAKGFGQGHWNKKGNKGFKGNGKGSKGNGKNQQGGKSYPGKGNFWHQAGWFAGAHAALGPQHADGAMLPENPNLIPIDENQPPAPGINQNAMYAGWNDDWNGDWNNDWNWDGYSGYDDGSWQGNGGDGAASSNAAKAE